MSTALHGDHEPIVAPHFARPRRRSPHAWLLPTPDLCRTIRTLSGHTRWETAQVLSVTTSTVMRWETGHQRPAGLAATSRYRDLLGQYLLDLIRRRPDLLV